MKEPEKNKIDANKLEKTAWTFRIPEEDRSWPDDPETVTITQMSVAQELDAAKVEGDLEYEIIRRTVTKLDGQPVTNLDWIERCSNPVRVWLRRAMNHINLPASSRNEKAAKKVQKAFFEGATREIA